MNSKNSIIEYYRKETCSLINKFTFTQGGTQKRAVDVWKTCMQKHIGTTATMTSRQHAEQIFNLGEHLRDVFFSTKDSSSTGRNQNELSSSGYLWERLVAYYLNYCLANSRTVVFIGATNFEAIKTAVTFNGMDTASEVDLLAITFPDIPEFTNDLEVLRSDLLHQYPRVESTPDELKFIHNRRIRSLKTIAEKFSDYYTKLYFADLGIHVVQCKTNWNDSTQIPMLWSLLYYLSRDNVNLPISSNINFGSGLYTLPRLRDFSYSFVTVPTQNNGEYLTDPIAAAEKAFNFNRQFSETNLPVLRAKLIRGGYYWGLPKHNTIFPISELLNRNLSNGLSTSHVVDNIQNNIDSGKYISEYNYFVNI